MLLESALVEQLEAKGTGEMLRMKLFTHCRDTFSSDGLLALGTQCSSLGMVVYFTVRLSFKVKVVPTWESDTTTLQQTGIVKV